MDDLDYDDGDYGSPWVTSDEHAICGACGFIGPFEVETEEAQQGDGVMTGTVTLATGRRRCAECEDERNLQDIPTPILEAVKALVQETLYENASMSHGISTRFLARMTLLRAAVGIKTPEPIVAEARAMFASAPQKEG